jgi:hypothetical protein
VNLHDQGSMAAARGEPDLARALYRQSLEIARASDYRPGILQLTESFAELITAPGQYALAAHLLSAAAREEMGILRDSSRAEAYERCLETLRHGLSLVEFRAE